MKLNQRVFLSLSIFLIGIGLAIPPTVVDAATIIDLKEMNSDGFLYKIASNKYIKASDVKIITNDNKEDPNMIATLEANDFLLKVTVPKAHLYDSQAKQLSKEVPQGHVYVIGSQDDFSNRTYYHISKNKLVSVIDSSL
ncbi:hypothetical protein LCR01_08750 [Companilactobacillus crustorum]|uniref:S-layer protein C-terminal domain-containing protein n=3 Tax=Companilactobacillus TaxID=2767879 RepID=A0A837RHC6_9LACO|nr:SLAP domain-containing protein [Companilactobacillus crustorum]HCD06705.1 hypothetical protein [Lactobacillus sp.]APU71928.1 hypothetical protein BI355_1623 [Companilactobacillus crustorum]KRK42666.1 hypothetical protein FD26_GL000405 [Companilactobacillus crustorum JCM 15951]KRO21272.1 hypothetical protein IV63_GL001731 [Companilactobacillus crustorum]WDT65989.1 hypothetical protein NV391_01785 [Companilactobacillus crustorum]